MAIPLYQFFITIPYISWTLAFFYTSLLTPRHWLKRPLPSVLIPTILVYIFLSIIKTQSATLGTNLIQIYAFLSCIIFFENKFLQKLSCFVIYDLTTIVVETISGNLFLMIRNILSADSMTFTSILQVTEMSDIILMSLLNALIGIIFFLKETPLMKQCFSLLNARVFFELILTLLTPILAQGLIIYQTENPHFPVLAGIYWFFCFLCYPIFTLGLRSIQRQERESLRKRNQLLLAKEQLTFSQNMEQEYISLRKWNHDNENHLMAISYLMEQKKTTDVIEYLKSLHINP